MDSETTRFTHEIDEEFHCSICAMILKKVMQSPCEHLYCSEFIKRWLAVDQSCPVERGPLQFEDIWPVVKSFRNVMKKFEIKCQFESKGCAEIVKLDNLVDHVGSCVYNPNATFDCDNNSNIQIRHLAGKELRQQEKILNLNDEVIRQHNEIGKLNDEMVSLRRQQKDYADEMIRQNDKIATLKDEVKSRSKEIQRLNDELNIRPREDELVKLNDEICSLRSQIGQLQNEIIPKGEEISPLSNENSNATNDLVNESPEFRLWGDIKISIDQLNVLKVDNGVGFAQSVFSLEQKKFSFKIEILSLRNQFGIGLHPDCELSLGDGTILYKSSGNLFIGGKFEKFGTKFKVGDIIECGIKFPNDFVNDGRRVQVYLNKNGELFGEKLVKMPIDGYFPIVYMGKGSKIKYLSK